MVHTKRKLGLDAKQIFDDGSFREFPSIAEARRVTGINHIWRVCQGLQAQTGYRWEYVERISPTLKTAFQENANAKINEEAKKKVPPEIQLSISNESISVDSEKLLETESIALTIKIRKNYQKKQSFEFPTQLVITSIPMTYFSLQHI
ncbi:hypothetical protein Glove_431g36 [Diversispora epigaea]|uniref:Uncharacterized protein n=1 Tax=Diversispora epigaea TaxID=1348612 RepID=A0A397GY93_9GLOM|nr:hypothetical protein Glove_431g36 [Diversispora epigaea]